MLFLRLEDALIDMPAGIFFVPLDQPLANQAIMALEPGSPEGFFAQGVMTDLHGVAGLSRPVILAHDEWAMPRSIPHTLSE